MYFSPSYLFSRVEYTSTSNSTIPSDYCKEEMAKSSRLTPSIMTAGGWAKIYNAWGYNQYAIVFQDADGPVILYESDFSTSTDWENFLNDLGLPTSVPFVITEDIIEG